jgi:hypothetical protein
MHTIRSLACRFGSVARLAVVAGMAIGGLALSPAVAQADDPGRVSFSGSKELFADQHFDTGFQPDGSPIQVRVQFDLGGGFNVKADGEASLGVTDPVQVALNGIDGTGSYDMDIGPQLQLSAKLHFSVLGQDIDWEGPIPLPGNIPIDLRFAQTKTFDPFLLGGQSVTVSDTISDVPVINVPVSSSLIPVPGVGGNLELLVGGELTSEFKGVSAEATPGVRNGDTITSTVSYKGHSTTTGTVILKPTFRISFLSFGHNFSISIPVDLPPIETDWDLGSQEVTLSAPAPVPPPNPETGGHIGSGTGTGTGEPSGGSGAGTGGSAGDQPGKGGTTGGTGGAGSGTSTGTGGGDASAAMGSGCSVSAGAPVAADAALALVLLGLGAVIGRRRFGRN